MTRYTVVWVKSAEDELVELWMVANNRNAITQAAYQVDQLLTIDPSSRGESLSEGLRALNVPPLRVVFSVNEDDCLVEVAVVRPI